MLPPRHRRQCDVTREHPHSWAFAAAKSQRQRQRTAISTTTLSPTLQCPTHFFLLFSASITLQNRYSCRRRIRSLIFRYPVAFSQR